MASPHGGIRSWALVLIVFLLLVSLALNGLALWRAFSLVGDVRNNTLTIGGVSNRVDALSIAVGPDNKQPADDPDLTLQSLITGAVLA